MIEPVSKKYEQEVLKDSDKESYVTKVSALFEQTLEPVSETRTLVGAIGDFASSVHEISEKSKTFLKGLRAVDFLQAPFDVRDFIQNVYEVQKAKGTSLLGSGWQLSAKALTLVGYAAEGCSILHEIGVVSDKVLRWIPMYEVVSTLSSVVDIGLQVKSIRDLNKVEKKFQSLVQRIFQEGKNPNKPKIIKKRIKGLKKLIEIAESNIELLEQKNLISSQTKVIQKIKIIAKNIVNNSYAVTNEDKSLFVKLQGRISLMKKLEILDVTVKIVSLAATIFVTFAFPLVIVGYSVLVLSATVSLVTWGGKFFLIDKDPFNETSKTLARSALDSFLHSLRQAKQLIAASN